MPSSTVVTTRYAAVGSPAASMISLQKAFEPSSCAPAASGPKQATPASASASASPATSGASGPTTTSSTASRTATSTRPAMSSTPTGSTRAISAIPALPGAQSSSGRCGERASACRIACSRAPPPTTRILGLDTAADCNQAGYATGATSGTAVKAISPSTASTMILSPSTKRPSRIASASGSTRRFWITRFSGRAP